MPRTRYHSVSHPVTPPLSTQYPMTEVTASISPATGSVSHTQKNAVSVSVSPRHHPGSHQLLSPPSTGHNCQSYCPMSRLFPVVVLRVLSHCVFFQGFPVVRAPIRPGPAWDTQPKAQGPASRNPGPSARLILARPVGFSPFQSAGILVCLSLCWLH